MNQDMEELNLEDRLTINALARRASETINKAVFDPVLLSKQRIKDLKKDINIGKRYSGNLRASLRDNMVRKYLSLLTTEEALAAVEAATLRVARNPDTTYGDQIPTVILRKEYFDFMDKAPSFSTLARRGRIKLHQIGLTFREMRERIVDAHIEASEQYDPAMPSEMRSRRY